MQPYIPYESGAEWHYLSAQFVSKYGYNSAHRFLFDLNRLTRAERTLYMSVYERTMAARGVPCQR
jgi:uncharacterized ferritin-like protein (DUF455 family)